MNEVTAHGTNHCQMGKLHIELPGELFLALLFRAFLFTHNLSG
jgi:hypothetical protein